MKLFLALVATTTLLSGCAVHRFPDGVECNPNKPRFYPYVQHRICPIQMEDYRRHLIRQEALASIEELEKLRQDLLNKGTMNMRVFRLCHGRGTITRRADGYDICSDPEIMKLVERHIPPFDDKGEDKLGLTF